jgi:hypothetical protein
MQDVDSFLAKAGLDAGVLCGCLEDLVRRRDKIKKTPLLAKFRSGIVLCRIHRIILLRLLGMSSSHLVQSVH